jgi:tRNA threonylcarbamoyladenosine biosynthesis protein TsaE
MMQCFSTHSVEETMNAAAHLAGSLRRGDVVTLSGELGTGKTQFVKGLCRAFHTTAQATSPSFVLVNRYDGTASDGSELFLYHFDWYRVKTIEEIYDLGYEEFLQSNGICVIEWAELFQELLPPHRYEVHLGYGETESDRVIGVEVRGEERGC